MLECVLNLSEGRNEPLIARLAQVAQPALLDVHRDPHHNRSVLTLAGTDERVEETVRSLARLAIGELDLRSHAGAHPRMGVVDVVPFVPLVRSDPGQARSPFVADPPSEPAQGARDRFARWIADELGVPAFCYGPLGPNRVRTLPELRREAFSTIRPDYGPSEPHRSAGACAVGARPFLVAYNLFVRSGDAGTARQVAAEIRGPAVRALGFELGGRAQVSCNLVDPMTVGPLEIYDEVARHLSRLGDEIEEAELVGLVPAAILANVPEERFDQLALGSRRTVEARMDEAGF